MNEFITQELALAAGIILLLLILMSSGIFITNEIFLAAIAACVVMLGVFGILIRNRNQESENPRDRRTGDRAAFFTVMSVILTAIIAEALTDRVDVWLWVIAGIGLLAKGIGLWRKRS